MSTTLPHRPARRHAVEDVDPRWSNPEQPGGTNTTFAGTLVEGAVAGLPLDVFLAGDDPGAKDTGKQCVRDGGLRAVDVGPLALLHHVEALGYLNMAIQTDLGHGLRERDQDPRLALLTAGPLQPGAE